MIEVKIIRYLTDALRMPVYAERPENPEAEYLLVERTGGGYRNCVRSATIAVQSYADSMYRAAEINQNVERAMLDFDALWGIGSCRLNSSYNFTDTDSRKYRYQAVFDIVYREGV